MRTEKEIKDQIAALKKIKPTVLRRSFFGDDHHAAIDAQIETLQNKYSYRTIDNRNGAEWEENEADSARSACDWMGGEDLEDGPTPADTWKELVRK